MSSDHSLKCTCGQVALSLSGAPRVRGHCHCNSCRTLLNIPYHSVTAWNPEQVEITAGADRLIEFQHPSLKMKKIYCSGCGEVMFNTNAMGWKVVSQHLIARNHGGILPKDFAAQSHFFYSERIVDIDDDLPKKG